MLGVVVESVAAGRTHEDDVLEEVAATVARVDAVLIRRHDPLSNISSHVVEAKGIGARG